jgi:hypothetical protein
MPDEADIAFDMIDASVANGVAAISATIAPGVAGECAECGEQMPRLVGGRCGFCRDGRLPPPSFYDSRPPASPVPPAPTGAPLKETAVTKPVTPTSKAISVPARDAVLAAIEELAEKHELPLGQAAIKLIEVGMGQRMGSIFAPVPVSRDGAPDLSDIAIDQLLGEVRRRAESIINQDAIDAAIGRAEAAERKLAAMRELIAG